MLITYSVTLILYRYSIMLQCWEEKPSNRPSFAKLKARVNKFMQDNSNFIHFPSPNNGYVTISEPYNPPSSNISGLLTPTPQGMDSYNPPPPSYDTLARAGSHSRSTSPVQRDRLEVSNRVRHHFSEPSLEGREGGLGPALEGDDSLVMVKRTQSNPYVRTPKRSKIQVRRSFERMFELPQIMVQSAHDVEENLQ